MVRVLAFVITVASVYGAVNAVHSSDGGIEVSRLFATKDVHHLLTIEKDRGTGCACVKNNCGCCAHLEVDEIGLNNTVCSNVTYLPEEIGVSLLISVDGVVYYNRTISARNPPPVCTGVPYLKQYASLCLKLYNLNVNKTAISGCMSIIAKLENVDVKRFDLGCFKIPPRTQHMVGRKGVFNPKTPTSLATRLKKTGCSCLYYECGCCMDLGQMSLGPNNADDTVCANLTFLTKASDVTLTFSVDEVVYYKTTIPVRNPPPVCFHFPDLTSVDLCVQFYQLDIKDAKLTGCLRMLTEVEGKVVETIDLGCFKFPTYVPQTPSWPLLDKDSHTSRLKNLMFLAYQEAKRGKLFDNI